MVNQRTPFKVLASAAARHSRVTLSKMLHPQQLSLHLHSHLPLEYMAKREISHMGSMKDHIVFIILTHSLNTMKLQHSQRESRKCV